MYRGDASRSVLVAVLARERPTMNPCVNPRLGDVHPDRGPGAYRAPPYRPRPLGDVPAHGLQAYKDHQDEEVQSWPHVPARDLILTPPSPAQRQLLEADLTVEQANVLLRHGTGGAILWGIPGREASGVFTCRLCGLPLFQGGQKFSGTGWPSFTAPFGDDHLREERDSELRHGAYGAALRPLRQPPGHVVFPDGPPPTGLRYCINSVSLDFTPEGESLPDKLGCGAPEGEPWHKGIGCVADCAPRHACLGRHQQ